MYRDRTTKGYKRDFKVSKGRRPIKEFCLFRRYNCKAKRRSLSLRYQHTDGREAIRNWARSVRRYSSDYNITTNRYSCLSASARRRRSATVRLWVSITRTRARPSKCTTRCYSA